MSVPRAALQALSAVLERWAADFHEATLAKPQREYYRGYGQGVRDGRDRAEHALKWLAGKDEQ